MTMFRFTIVSLFLLLSLGDAGYSSKHYSITGDSEVEQDAKLVQTEIALLPKLRGGAKSEKEKKAKKVKTHPSGHGANLPKSIDERAFEKAEKKVKIKVEKVQNSVSTRKIGKQEKEEEEESDASVAPEKAGRDKGVTKQKREKSDKAAKVDKGAD